MTTLWSAVSGKIRLASHTPTLLLICIHLKHISARNRFCHKETNFQAPTKKPNEWHYKLRKDWRCQYVDETASGKTDVVWQLPISGCQRRGQAIGICFFPPSPPNAPPPPPDPFKFPRPQIIPNFFPADAHFHSLILNGMDPWRPKQIANSEMVECKTP